MSVRVVKLGGSLFRFERLPTAFAAWRAQQESSSTLVIVGGGEDVDRLRGLKDVSVRDSPQIHWQAVALLAGTARRMATQLQLPLIDQADAVRRFMQTEDWAIFQPVEWFATVSPGPGTKPSPPAVDNWRMNPSATPVEALPESWDVTTDSIAALLAIHLQADELVLLKSCGPTSDSAVELASAGFVDRHFPQLAPLVPRIRLVNLRDERFAETVVAQGSL